MHKTNNVYALIYICVYACLSLHLPILHRFLYIKKHPLDAFIDNVSTAPKMAFVFFGSQQFLPRSNLIQRCRLRCHVLHMAQANKNHGPIRLTAKWMAVYIYIYIPRAPMTSIFEGQPLKTRPFPSKTRVIWVLGIYK